MEQCVAEGESENGKWKIENSRLGNPFRRVWTAQEDYNPL
jgi:hypothetical protein